jgi:macrolide transport system ATP-binding/permease protein
MTRNRIAGALSDHSRLLLADEPTTDLDEEGLKLLRKQLKGFDGAVVLVSHDRALLRALCNRIWYLEDGKITDFPGGYDDFMAERNRRRERAVFEYDQYKSEQKRLRETAQRMRKRLPGFGRPRRAWETAKPGCIRGNGRTRSCSSATRNERFRTGWNGWK